MINLDFPCNITLMHELCKAQMAALPPLSAPIRLQRQDHVYSLGLGLSSRCNFRCPICYYHGSDDKISANRTHDMPLYLLERILADMPILDRVVIGLEGEPFCYPYFFQALDIIRPKTDSFALVSNGSLLTKERCRRLEEYPVSSLSLSIDAADALTYARLRSGGDFTTFKKHAAQTVHHLGKIVSLHTVIFAENSHTVPDMPQLAAELGIQRLSLQQIRMHTGVQQRGVHPASTPVLRDCLEKTMQNAQKYGVAVYITAFFANHAIMHYLQKLSTEYSCLRLESAGAARQQTQCSYLRYFTSILSDGRLFPCCGNFCPAPIEQYSFNDIFNHTYLQYLRILHALGRIPEPCLCCRYEEEPSLSEIS